MITLAYPIVIYCIYIVATRFFHFRILVTSLPYPIELTQEKLMDPTPEKILMHYIKFC